MNILQELSAEVYTEKELQEFLGYSSMFCFSEIPAGFLLKMLFRFFCITTEIHWKVSHDFFLLYFTEV